MNHGVGESAPRGTFEVRRESDGELCGFVRVFDVSWWSVTVFGGVLDTHETRDDAEQHVLQHGLTSLAERWSYRSTPSEKWQVVCIQEASIERVQLALDYYSLPGVPTVVVSSADLEAGAELRLRP